MSNVISLAEWKAKHQFKARPGAEVEVGTCYGVANLISAGSILNNITELARRSTSPHSRCSG